MPASKSKSAKPKAGQNKQSAEQRAKLFVEAYLSNNQNASKAALAAGFSPKSAASQGSRLLKNVKVRQLLDSRREETIEKVGIETERTLQEVWNIVTADPRELVEYRVGCCRFCWGKGFRYQRTANEMARDRAAHAAQVAQHQAGETKGKPPGPFDEAGGGGFLLTREPNAACPECGGEGVGRSVFKDTRKVSAVAASLFAGVKETKDGLEIKLHSKVDALEKAMRHLGLYKKDNEQAKPVTRVVMVPAKEAT